MAPHRRAARLVIPHVLVLVAALACVLGWGGPEATAAAWTDPAMFSAQATTATWTVPPPANSCEVRNVNGTLDATKPCTVGAVTASYWGSAGAGQGGLQAQFSAPGIGITQHVEFTLTIPSAGKPAWWSWANGSVTLINNGGSVTSSCSALPTLTGREGANRGASPNIYIEFADNRSAGTPLCAVP